MSRSSLGLSLSRLLGTLRRQRVLRRCVSAFCLVLMLQSQGIALWTPLHAEMAGATTPEASKFESVNTTDLVNLVTGQLVYSLPVLEVPGPEGGYPLALHYHSGILQGEEASWVGLGWNLHPGAIVRNTRGVPDDDAFGNHSIWGGNYNTETSETSTDVTSYSYSYEGVQVGVTQVSGQGMSGSIGFDIVQFAMAQAASASESGAADGAKTSDTWLSKSAKSMKNTGIGLSGGVGLAFGPGGTQAFGFAGVSLGSSGAVAGNICAGGGLNFGYNTLSGSSVGVGFSMDYMTTKDKSAKTAMGISFSSGGGFSLSGSSSGFASYSYQGATTVRDTVIPKGSVTIPTPIGNFSWSKETHKIKLYSTSDHNYVGYLYHPAPPAPPDPPITFGSTSGNPYRINEWGLETTPSDKLPVPPDPGDDYLERTNFSLQNDIFMVQGEGVGGTFRAHRNHDSVYSPTPAEYDSQTPRPLFLPTEAATFTFDGDSAWSYKRGWSALSNDELVTVWRSIQSDPMGADTYAIPGFDAETFSKWRMYDPNRASRKIVPLYGKWCDSSGTDPFSLYFCKQKPLWGFQITESDGRFYQYGMGYDPKLPLGQSDELTGQYWAPYINFSAEEIRYTTTENQTDWLKTWANIAGGATQWSLSELHYPDYFEETVPMATGTQIIKHGGWVSFQYTHPVRYRWSNTWGTEPSDFNSYLLDTPDAQKTSVNGAESKMRGKVIGLKTMGYPLSIETATHKALFVTSTRLDGREFQGLSTGRYSTQDVKYKHIPPPPYGGVLKEWKIPLTYTEVPSYSIPVGSDAATVNATVGQGFVDYCIANHIAWEPTATNTTPHPVNFDIRPYPMDQTYHVSSFRYDPARSCYTFGDSSGIQTGRDENGNPIIYDTPSRMQKLDRIVLYEKSTDTIVKEVVFSYSYELSPGTPNSMAPNQGKLTLVGYQVFGLGGRAGGASLPMTRFSYGDNPQWESQWAYDRWGFHRSGGSAWYHDSAYPADATAWNLRKVILPTGGQIQFDYEPVDYLYVQNRMVSSRSPRIGNGARVRSITTTDGRKHLATSYIYADDGKSSGVVSQLPHPFGEGKDIDADNTEYGGWGDEGGPAVYHGRVTVRNCAILDKNPASPSHLIPMGETVYRFVTPKDIPHIKVTPTQTVTYGPGNYPGYFPGDTSPASKDGRNYKISISENCIVSAWWGKPLWKEVRDEKGRVLTRTESIYGQLDPYLAQQKWDKITDVTDPAPDGSRRSYDWVSKSYLPTTADGTGASGGATGWTYNKQSTYVNMQVDNMHARYTVGNPQVGGFWVKHKLTRQLTLFPLLIETRTYGEYSKLLGASRSKVWDARTGRPIESEERGELVGASTSNTDPWANHQSLVTQKIPAYWVYPGMAEKNMLTQEAQSTTLRRIPGQENLYLNSTIQTWWQDRAGGNSALDRWVRGGSFVWNGLGGAPKDFFNATDNVGRNWTPAEIGSKGTGVNAQLLKTSHNWIFSGAVTQYDGFVHPIEEVDGDRAFACMKYGYPYDANGLPLLPDFTRPVAKFGNARNVESLYLNFEGNAQDAANNLIPAGTSKAEVALGGILDPVRALDKAYSGERAAATPVTLTVPGAVADAGISYHELRYFVKAGNGSSAKASYPNAAEVQSVVPAEGGWYLVRAKVPSGSTRTLNASETGPIDDVSAFPWRRNGAPASVSHYAYDRITGLVTSMTGSNGRTARYQYDKLGRLMKVYDVYGKPTTVTRYGYATPASN